jgi:hypothetical protein
MTAETRAVAETAAALGGDAQATDSGRALRVQAGGASAEIALPADWQELGDLPGGLPSRARGDQREKIIYNILQDAGGVPPRERLSAESLLEQLPELLSAGDPTSRRVLSRVLRAQYWVRPERTRASRVEFPIPYHSALPASYDYRGRYKSFTGTLLAFLCWTGDGIDRATMDALFDYFNATDDLTELDLELIQCAQKLADAKPAASTDSLLERREVAVLLDGLSGGVMYPAALERFRSDLRAVLALELPRHDKVAAVVLTFSVHIGLYYYRLALDLGEGILGVTAAAADQDGPPGGGNFVGRIRFRVGVGTDRPVRASDPCAQSFLELDEQHLLALPANIEVANLLQRIWAAAGGSASGPPRLADLELAMRADPSLAQLVDVAAGTLGVLYGSRTGSRPAEALTGAVRPGAGLHMLREIVLDRYRIPTNRLRQRGRDVVATLLRRPFGGSLIRNRGNVRFFEMDEELLFLFVRWALARSRRPHIPLTAFLDLLNEYGLQPQSDDEAEEIADALQRLGLLVRYSDAGEAQYVRLA